MAIASKITFSFAKRPVVLVAPLDWGLGHATRCIPLIHYLLNLGAEVIIASDGPQKIILEVEFPSLRFVRLPGYRLRYGNGKYDTILKIVLQIPKILSAVRREREWLAKFVTDNQVNAVVADNRYGLYIEGLPCIFITHQLTIKTPFGPVADALLRELNYRFIRNFSGCWIPDYKGTRNLAGELSHPPSLPAIPVAYLGRLSRLAAPPVETKNPLLIILSGPEPQRTIFEELLFGQLEKCGELPCIFVRGLPGLGDVPPRGNRHTVVYNHLETTALQSLMAGAEVVISRSGYSTVMDLAGMGCKCIFVPTPGQTEQEYLARYLSGQNRCLSYRQDRFDLDTALKQVREVDLLPEMDFPGDEYKQVVYDFVAGLQAPVAK